MKKLKTKRRSKYENVKFELNTIHIIGGRPYRLFVETKETKDNIRMKYGYRLVENIKIET